MGGPRYEVVSRCSNCYGDSPKAFLRERNKSMKDSSSEYQSKFREWPWQGRLASLRPGEGGTTSRGKEGKSRAPMEQKTTYKIDFVGNTGTSRKRENKIASEAETDADDTHAHMAAPRLRMQAMQLENSQVIQPTRNQAFSSDTNYIKSYKPFDTEIMASSKQQAIRARDNIEIPATGDATGSTKSTAQDDFVKHENVHRPSPIRPVENNGPSTAPLDQRTEYKDFYTAKSLKEAQPGQIRKKMPTLKLAPPNSDVTYNAISTAMADFVTPKNAERSVACVPPGSNHFSKDKFEASTTFSRAFKSWPVKQYEAPIWAQKPKYKKPEGGMIKNSLYMHDFRNPELIKPPTPIRPQHRKENPVMNADLAHVSLDPNTTYKLDFRRWENAHPRETYKVIEMYEPPKERMDCDTHQKLNYTGQSAPRMSPCRHTSQHRDLYIDTSMVFATTYNETFQNPRGIRHGPPATAPPRQAVQKPKSPVAPVAVNAIPTPDLVIMDHPANTIGVLVMQEPTGHSSSTPTTEVNVLTIVRCDKCNNEKDKCLC